MLCFLNRIALVVALNTSNHSFSVYCMQFHIKDVINFILIIITQPKEPRATADFDSPSGGPGSSSIRRSHSQSQLNKPR